MYLSRLKEEILAIDTKLGYSNLTREEKKALKPLKDDVDIIIIKEAGKGLAVVVWDREDLQEASKQLGVTPMKRFLGIVSKYQAESFKDKY